MSAIVELSIFPMDKGESVSAYVAGVLDIIRNSGVAYELGPMGTCLEGDWEDVSTVVNKCFEHVRADSSRVYMTMKVDWRAGRKNGLRGKMDSVNAKLD